MDITTAEELFLSIIFREKNVRFPLGNEHEIRAELADWARRQAEARGLTVVDL